MSREPDFVAAQRDLMAYLDASPSPWHGVEESVRRLAAEGYAPLSEGRPWSLSAGSSHYVVRDGSVIAFRVGTESPCEAGFRILGAHLDSPNLRLKPHPEMVRNGFLQLSLEVYGGVLLATWADRDLGICGRLLTDDGAGGVAEHRVRIDEPLARISNLAIHLNRSVNDKGLVLNPETQLPPLVALADEPGALLERVAEEAGIERSALLAFDLMLHDTQPATTGGLNNDFLFSPRLDDQAMSWACLEGLLQAPALARHTQVVALFNHEEIGSTTMEGANGNLLQAVLERCAAAFPGGGGLWTALANSYMISADMAHAVHPGYSDKHAKGHMPKINGGIVIKTNTSGRYATSGRSKAELVRLCREAGVPYQEFANRADLRCGSTIGPMAASRLGIPVVDLGIAQHSMHSIREMCGTRDPAWARVLFSQCLS